MTTHSTELEAELDEIDYSKDAKEVGVVNMPNYYIIPRWQLKQLIADRERKAEIRGLEWCRKRPHGGQAGANEIEDRLAELNKKGEEE